MFQPLGENVLIKPIPNEEVTKSGIVIPGSSKESSNEGEVIALGNGKLKEGKKHDFSVKVGDRVVYRYGTDVEIDDEKYEVVEEDNILGIRK